MGPVKQWLLGIVLTAFAVGLARQLAPKGREAAMVRMVGGLLLVLAILRPLSAWGRQSIALPVGSFSSEIQEQTERYRENQIVALDTLIEEKTAAYIWDKASGLGISCRVSVRAEAGESGIPLPVEVTVVGTYSEPLAAWLEEEMGLGAEKQIWLEEGEWIKGKENER